MDTRVHDAIDAVNEAVDGQLNDPSAAVYAALADFIAYLSKLTIPVNPYTDAGIQHYVAEIIRALQTSLHSIDPRQVELAAIKLAESTLGSLPDSPQGDDNGVRDAVTDVTDDVSSKIFAVLALALAGGALAITVIPKITALTSEGVVRVQTAVDTTMTDLARKTARVASEGKAREWMWVTKLDADTCRACLSLHGQTFPATEKFAQGHPRCRCQGVPINPEEGKPETVDVEKWLKKLPKDKQQKILTQRGYNAFVQGKFGREAWATLRRNKDWRDTWQPAPAPQLDDE